MFGKGSIHRKRQDSPDEHSDFTYTPVRTPQQMNSSHTFDMLELLSLSLGTVKRYAETWGYPYWIASEPLAIGPHKNFMGPVWTKEFMTLSLVLNELRKPESERLEWIV